MQIYWLVLFLILIFGLCGCSSSAVSTNGSNDLPVRCLDVPEPGPCKASVVRYFYDYRYDSCRPFRYGGCQGHVPFETLDACEEICVGGGP